MKKLLFKTSALFFMFFICVESILLFGGANWVWLGESKVQLIAANFKYNQMMTMMMMMMIVTTQFEICFMYTLTFLGESSGCWSGTPTYGTYHSETLAQYFECLNLAVCNWDVFERNDRSFQLRSIKPEKHLMNYAKWSQNAK